MKYIYLLLLLAAIHSKAQYKGGVNDGSAVSTIIQTQNPLNNIYKGGANDGFHTIQTSTQNPLNNIYNGGVNDGFSVVMITGQNPLGNIYAGGNNDGFASGMVINQNTLQPARWFRLCDTLAGHSRLTKFDQV